MKYVWGQLVFLRHIIRLFHQKCLQKSSPKAYFRLFFHFLTEIAIKSKQNRGRNFQDFWIFCEKKRDYESRFFFPHSFLRYKKISTWNWSFVRANFFLHHFFYNLCTLDHLLLNLEPVTLKNESVVAKYLIFCWKCKMAFWLG